MIGGLYGGSAACQTTARKLANLHLGLRVERDAERFRFAGGLGCVNLAALHAASTRKYRRPQTITFFVVYTIANDDRLPIRFLAEE
jgi:hypothetical protein